MFLSVVLRGMYVIKDNKFVCVKIIYFDFMELVGSYLIFGFKLINI